MALQCACQNQKCRAVTAVAALVKSLEKELPKLRQELRAARPVHSAQDRRSKGVKAMEPAVTGETEIALLLQLKKAELYNDKALVAEVSAHIRELEGRCQQAIGVKGAALLRRLLRKERLSFVAALPPGMVQSFLAWCQSCQLLPYPVAVSLDDDDDAELSMDSAERAAPGESGPACPFPPVPRPCAEQRPDATPKQLPPPGGSGTEMEDLLRCIGSRGAGSLQAVCRQLARGGLR